MPAVRVPVLPESYVDAYPVTVAPTVSLPSPSPHVDAGPIPTATPAVAVPPTRRLQISVSALCLLLWLGGVAMMAGGAISLFDRRFRVGAPSRNRIALARSDVPAE